MKANRLTWYFLLVFSILYLTQCSVNNRNKEVEIKISIVNAPTDIVTQGAIFLAERIQKNADGKIIPRVYHSGVLSGGKGSAEIELCQQGTIEIHITTTAYLANQVPETSIFSLPFLFRDIDQVITLVKSESPVLQQINAALNEKRLHVIAWWPRGFRQLTNSKRLVKELDDIQGLRFRVMTNRLFVDAMNAMGAHPVPMDWGEVYNALQLMTIDGQENAEDVIHSSKLYEVQKFMTVWDYSTDLEVVMVNLDWWLALDRESRTIVQEAADASVDFQIKALLKNTEELREEIVKSGMQIHYMDTIAKQDFKLSVRPVWEKYAGIFGESFTESFIEEINRF